MTLDLAGKTVAPGNYIEVTGIHGLFKLECEINRRFVKVWERRYSPVRWTLFEVPSACTGATKVRLYGGGYCDSRYHTCARFASNQLLARVGMPSGRWVSRGSRERFDLWEIKTTYGWQQTN